MGSVDNRVVATVMGGYDGHRGWIYYLAVDPAYQKMGLGRQIMEAIEQKILATGCPKVNLQIRADNNTVVEFYKNIISRGMNRCQALRQAALKEMNVVKERYDHPNPFFWGAFIFLGEP